MDRRRPRPHRELVELYPAPLANPRVSTRPPPDSVSTVWATWSAVLARQAAVALPLWVAVVALLVVTSPPWPVVLAVAALGVALTAVLAQLARPRLLVTSCHLEQHGLFRRESLPWAAVAGMQAAYEPSHRPGGPYGVLLALDSFDGGDGARPVRLAATRRRAVDLPMLAANIEAHRVPGRSCPHRN